MEQARSLARSAYSLVFKSALALVERDLVPDFVVRVAIRGLLAGRLAKERQGGEEEYQARLQSFVEELKSLPIAVQTNTANEQHYEVPTSYFLLCLGKHLKYSSCLYPGLNPRTSLDSAEEAMLELCCSRAEIADGQEILELGCGWGSLCLYVAAKYPRSRVTAVSNSRTQKKFIDNLCELRGIGNLRVVTADVVSYEADRTFDRVLSVEMFEHMKNYKDEDEDDWMAKHFFSGGTMPSANLLHFFQDDLTIQRQWWINGRHYSLTLEAWLARQDSRRKDIMPIMKETYGKADGLKWWVRWRLFYMACSELFKYNQGNEWGVTHLLFCKK